MRMTLLDWIMRIHLKFKLKPETFFKTIYILDNYTKSGKIIKENINYWELHLFILLVNTNKYILLLIPLM